MDISHKSNLIKNSFADFVMIKRKQLNISQGELAGKTGVKRSTISMIEAKKNGMNFDSAVMILNGLGVGLAEFDNYLKEVIIENN